MNTYTRANGVKAIFLATVSVIGMGWSMISMAATDSTQFKRPVDVKVVLPQATPDTTDCKEANINEHDFYASFYAEGGSSWKTSTCPTGYMPYQLQTYAVGTMAYAGAGKIQFSNYCCKVKVAYS